MGTQHTIDVLTVHRANLLEAKTFEDYRNAHVAYVDMLIGRLEGDLAKEESVQRWIVTTGKPEVEETP